MSISVMTTVWTKAPVEGGELLLMLALADNANDDGVAFPSIAYLARKARMTGRNVQLCLRKLESKGLMRVIPNAGMSGTNKYRLELKAIEQFRHVQDGGEDVGGENISPPKSAPGRGEKFSPGGEAHFTGGVKNDAQGGEAHFTQTVIEPSINLSDAQTRVREAISSDEVSKSEASEQDGDQGNEDVRQIRRAFQSLIKGWPGFEGMPIEATWKVYLTLAPEDRKQAANRRDDWFRLLRDQGKSYTPAPSKYLKEELWKRVPDRAEPQAGSPQLAKPFGKLWTCHVLKALRLPPAAPPPPSAFQRKAIEDGGESARRILRDRKAAHGWPHVNRIFEAAMDGRGCAVSAADVGELPEMEAVEKNSLAFDEWRIAFTEAGLPWMRVSDGVPFVWLPKGGPGEWVSGG